MAGLSDILTAIQNGVTALNNLGQQVKGSFTSIASQLAILQTPACFSVNKNGVDQTAIADSTFTLVTWSTEVYDVGNHFASNGWTPPAGKIHLDACVLITGTFVTGNQVALTVFKNGVSFAQGNSLGSAPLAAGGVSVSCNDIASGTDVYTVQVFADVSAGTATVLGATSLAYFGGFWVTA